MYIPHYSLYRVPQKSRPLCIFSGPRAYAAVLRPSVGLSSSSVRNVLWLNGAC